MRPASTVEPASAQPPDRPPAPLATARPGCRRMVCSSEPSTGEISSRKASTVPEEVMVDATPSPARSTASEPGAKGRGRNDVEGVGVTLRDVLGAAVPVALPVALGVGGLLPVALGVPVLLPVAVVEGLAVTLDEGVGVASAARDADGEGVADGGGGAGATARNSVPPHACASGVNTSSTVSYLIRKLPTPDTEPVGGADA